MHRFVDRDMFMWFHGGRIGHKAICNWDEFLLLEGHGHDKAVVMFWPSLASDSLGLQKFQARPKLPVMAGFGLALA